jgi:hypothetical protein
LSWEYLERIVNENGIIIDRPKGTRHPEYNKMVYMVDYDYIKIPNQWIMQAWIFFSVLKKAKNLYNNLCNRRIKKRFGNKNTNRMH